MFVQPPNHGLDGSKEFWVDADQVTVGGSAGATGTRKPKHSPQCGGMGQRDDDGTCDYCGVRM